MHFDSYSPVSNHTHDAYEFLNEGPKGTIKKLVLFQPLSPGMYNLAFADWDEEVQEISDEVRTNNTDRDKVLATVAATVLYFMAFHPGAVLFAQGSTPARTRLYQMGIRSNWHAISPSFDVLGLTTAGWEPLAPNKNYKAFALKAKEKM